MVNARCPAARRTYRTAPIPEGPDTATHASVERKDETFAYINLIDGDKGREVRLGTSILGGEVIPARALKFQRTNSCTRFKRLNLSCFRTDCETHVLN
jgi:hypothetical protein